MSEAMNYAPASVEAYDLPEVPAADMQRLVERFIHHEAHLLDSYDLLGWLKLLTPDIDYRMPTRSTIDDMDMRKSFSDKSFHMIEDYGSLAARMERLQSGAGWSEKPPSRVRRHISGIHVGPPDGDDVPVRSNLLFFWVRDKDPIVVSAERQDRVRLVDGRPYLARRLVLLDHVSIPIPNLSVVL